MLRSILASVAIDEVATRYQDEGPSPSGPLRLPLSHNADGQCSKASVRQASSSDMRRIAIVASAAFYHSPSFKYERPDYRRYPQDTLADYQAMFESAAADESSLVMVIEDSFRPDEADFVYPELRDSCLRLEHTHQDREVVAVMSAVLSPDSHRRGLHQCRG